MLHYVDVKSSGEVSSTKWEEVKVLFESDVTRLKKDIKAITSKDSLNADVVAIVNASVLTMQAGKFESDFIDNGILLYQDGEISAVGKSGSVDIPTGAHVINAQGGTAPSLFWFMRYSLTFRFSRAYCSWVYRRTRSLGGVYVTNTYHLLGA